jgi:hypothetical protein
MRTVFPTKEMRDEAVKKYRAIEGGQQTPSKLAAYVTGIIPISPAIAVTTSPLVLYSVLIYSKVPPVIPTLWF